MKKLLLIILLLFNINTIYSQNLTYYTNSVYTNIKSDTSIYSTTIKRLYKYSNVIVIDSLNYWYKIQYLNIIGYIQINKLNSGQAISKNVKYKNGAICYDGTKTDNIINPCSENGGVKRWLNVEKIILISMITHQQQLDKYNIEKTQLINLKIQQHQQDSINIIISKQKELNKIFDTFDVEIQPTPIGGYKKFYAYITKEKKYPAQAQKLGIEGKVYVKFIINKDGSISDVKAVELKTQAFSTIDAGCKKEAVRIIKNAPKWNPGKHHNKYVKVRASIFISFRLNE